MQKQLFGERIVFVFDSAAELADHMVDEFKCLCEQAVRERGVFTVAFPGGRTPVPFYQKLAERGREIPWDKVHVFQTDERFVPQNDPESNFRKLQDNLLSKITIPSQNIHAIPILDELEASAFKYDEELRKYFALAKGQLPQFDLLLLGIGREGHVASVFSGDEPNFEKHHLVMPVDVGQLRFRRVTMEMRLINAARKIYFLVTGQEKAPVMHEVLGKESLHLPASLVSSTGGRTVYLLDKEAASLLEPVPAGVPEPIVKA